MYEWGGVVAHCLWPESPPPPELALPAPPPPPWALSCSRRAWRIWSITTLDLRPRQGVLSFGVPFRAQRHPSWRSFRRQIGIGRVWARSSLPCVSRSRGQPLIFGGAAPYRLARCSLSAPLGWQNRGRCLGQQPPGPVMLLFYSINIFYPSTHPAYRSTWLHSKMKTSSRREYRTV